MLLNRSKPLALDINHVRKEYAGILAEVQSALDNLLEVSKRETAFREQHEKKFNSGLSAVPLIAFPGHGGPVNVIDLELWRDDVRRNYK